nr:siroheme synthase CysG [Maritalea mobilis]
MMTKLGIFPVSMKVRGKKIVIAGGGPEALAKARLAAKTDAHTIVVARKIFADFGGLDITVLEQPFTEDLLEGAAMVFSGDEGPDADLAKEAARAHGIPLNVVDKPDECDFYTPAIVDRAPLSVAISSEGEAPVMARLVRAKIEALLPLSLGKIVKFTGGLREKVEQTIHSGDQRRKFYQDLLASPKYERLVAGDQDQDAHLFADWLMQARAEGQGFVHLVGAGPGAEDLLTLRAQRVLQSADVIVHDQLVPDAIVEMGRRDAERFAVGKAKGRHSFTQKRINQMLVDLAKQGKRVVRLKSGDPMIFGRAGEEIAHLRANNVDFDIVPGITSALAAAADSETAVTLRNVSSGIVFATAHGADNQVVTHWASLAKSGISLGIYMGKSILADVANDLIAHGLAGSTPVGVVVNAGRENSTRHLGTLADAEQLKEQLAEGPAIVFIGEAIASGNWQQFEAQLPQTLQVA